MKRANGIPRIVVLLFSLLFVVVGNGETQQEHNARMSWFREARFGLFIHWGLYAVPAGEWNGNRNYGEWFLEETKMPVSQYEKYAAEFNPVQFNAADWVRMAKDSGMKYIVITSKHHDGFGLWPSDLTDWCIKSTPFKRDPLKELADACKKEGIRLCFYHSIMDWHHPDWGTRRAWNDTATGTPDMDRYVTYMKGQLKELVTRYGPLGILWFDGEWESPWTHARGLDLYNYVRGLQPDIIINNRVGKGRGGMSGMDTGTERVGDYGTPEQEIPPTGFGPGVDWESCMTMNDHWGYNKSDQNWKSTEVLVRNLIDCASKGGNYLLNVGPTAQGTFPQASVDRLAEIGRWMKVNGKAIYNTQASPFKRLPWGRCTSQGTARGTTLYLHVFDWPSDGTLLVPGLENKPGKAWLLADSSGKGLTTKKTDAGVTIAVPPKAPDALSTTLVLQIAGKPVISEPVLHQDASGAAVLPAADAVVHGAQLRLESGPGHNNLGYWLDPKDWASWELLVIKPGVYNVSAEMGAPKSSKVRVIVGGHALEGAVEVTGDYGKYSVMNLGRVEIKKAGKATVELHAVDAGWNPVNVRFLKLTPAQ